MNENHSQEIHELGSVKPKFLGEQDGIPERELKARLSVLFENRPSLTRAYLARVGYDNSAEQNVMLCMRSDLGEDRMLMQDIGDIFRPMFSKNMHLDMAFLADEDEKELSKVCRPFYGPSFIVEE